MPLQRSGGAGQTHTGEGMEVAERGVGHAGQAIRLLLEDVLPVGAEPRRAGRIRSEQEGVQLVDDVLADTGLKLPGEEGGSGGLLQSKDYINSFKLH